eukprot:507168-Prymnesium_polylepis.4
MIGARSSCEIHIRWFSRVAGWVSIILGRICIAVCETLVTVDELRLRAIAIGSGLATRLRTRPCANLAVATRLSATRGT